MCFMYENGITQGYNNALKPKENITRAEAAVIIRKDAD
ncbi:MAG: S-layer homology domain-containing protein [Dethiobacteria bacterium]